MALKICVLVSLLVINISEIFGTEVQRSGACPTNIQPLNNFTLDMLNGFYAAMRMNQDISYTEWCYRMTFRPVNDTVTAVITRSRVAANYNQEHPNRYDYSIRKTDRNGVFEMITNYFGDPIATMYVLSNNNGVILLYTCRNVEYFHNEDILALSKTFSYTDEDNTLVHSVCYNNGLNCISLKDEVQEPKYCYAIMPPEM